MSAILSTTSATGAVPAPTPRRDRGTPIAARGEPLVWLCGAGLALAGIMILSLLSIVMYNGSRTFWPGRIVELTLRGGGKVLGEVERVEIYRPTTADLERADPEERRLLAQSGDASRRRLIRTGNYDLYGDDFKWVSDAVIAEERYPSDVWKLERLEWGVGFGRIESILGKPLSTATDMDASYRDLRSALTAATERRRQLRAIERGEIDDLNREMERSRLNVRKAALVSGEGSAQHRAAAAEAAGEEQRLLAAHAVVEERMEAIRAQDRGARVAIREVGGKLLPERPSAADEPLLLSQIIRAYPANALGTFDRLRIYLDRWREFLTAEPREANTEGGVFPAIFGTFLMTVLMSLAVAPFGVITALYLREYARQGPLVAAVRIAVNNLAGVPSIVFGVFGLGFFCYFVGGQVDALFFSERLPSPTFGTGGILWASLTLALLTVPVVIVATEEALAAVPRSMREGSYACGASKWQTIQRIVLPSATPGILTGLILAMARGAGEVAPLMITGVVKLAPELPFDRHFPYLHLERSFMHLGFHIYDVGFQSRNSEAGKPMVFTTTLLLIALIAILDLSAGALRARLKRRYRTGHF